MRARNKYISLRVTSEEKKLLYEKAKEKKMSLTDCIIFSVIGDRGKIQAFFPVIAKLNEVRGEIKRLKDEEAVVELNEKLDLIYNLIYKMAQECLEREGL